jgi:hypothetical protein
MSLSPTENAWLADAMRRDESGWIELRISGPPYRRGFQHGYLLAAELEEVLRVNRFLLRWTTGNDMAWFAAMAERMYLHKVAPEIVEEMEGIAAGARRAGVETSLPEILAWNANAEMTMSWWPLVAENPPAGPASHHCSALIATGSWTADGGIVMAQNTWDTYANGARTRVILHVIPKDGFPILMQTSPGMVHSGTDFFVTGAGIVGTETTFAGFNKYDDKRTPEFSRVRMAMQYATDLEQWMRIMRTDNNGGYANSWLIGDIRTGEIVRFELGLRFVGVERTSDGYFWGCNIIADPKIRNQEAQNVGYSDVSQDAGRRVRWNQLAREHKGSIDTDTAKKMLADHWDVLNRKDQPCNRSICGHFDLDPTSFTSWDFEPFFPFGAVDAKVTSTALARDMSLWARAGHPCGRAFSASEFIARHEQFDWLEGYLTDMPARPWTLFAARPA